MLASDKRRQAFKVRLIVAWLMVVIFIGILIGRLFFLQVVQVEHFETLSEKNRLKIVPIPPPRGIIFDRHGVPLAENEVSYSLEILPEQAENPNQERLSKTQRTDNLNHLLDKLTALINLSEGDLRRFKKLRARSQRFKPLLLKSQLTKEEVAILSVRSYDLNGVQVTPTLTRVYPMGMIGAHAIGYVGRINEKDEKELEKLKEEEQTQYEGTQFIGKTGIEKYYESQLHGKIGYQEVEVNATGQIIRTLKKVDPIPGDNLYLHLDIMLQKKAEELFDPNRINEQSNLELESEKGALVAIDPTTGGVLALVSSPGFDPNLFVKGIDQQTYQELNDEDERPLYNRAVTGVYPPGSTIKPLIGLAGLEYEERTIHNKTYCPGWFTLGDDPHKFRDWKREGHGHVDLHDAIEQSCDVYFYDLAEDLGIKRIADFLKRFNLGEKTGIDIFGEVSGLIPTPEWKRKRHKAIWYPGETLIAGIGQGYMLVTPLQLAMATATLSMKGRVYLPKMVFARETGPTQQRTMTFIPSQAPTRIDLKHPQFWDYIISAMEAVIIGADGTANKLSENLAYRMAGKTGTAQVVQIKQDQQYDASALDKEHQDHALFIAFAPIDDPKIAVAVIVENGGSGGRTAAPLAKQLIDFYLFDRLGYYISEEIK